MLTINIIPYKKAPVLLSMWYTCINLGTVRVPAAARAFRFKNTERVTIFLFFYNARKMLWSKTGTGRKTSWPNVCLVTIVAYAVVACIFKWINTKNFFTYPCISLKILSKVRKKTFFLVELQGESICSFEKDWTLGHLLSIKEQHKNTTLYLWTMINLQQP